ncbi:MAG: hypothetical protein JKY67_00180 [Pseudomonadales bacterium]|nr:hypothetical protein [Pseudomonadales bacterium]
MNDKNKRVDVSRLPITPIETLDPPMTIDEYIDGRLYITRSEGGVEFRVWLADSRFEPKSMYNGPLIDDDMESVTRAIGEAILIGRSKDINLSSTEEYTAVYLDGPMCAPTIVWINVWAIDNIEEWEIN